MGKDSAPNLTVPSMDSALLLTLLRAVDETDGYESQLHFKLLCDLETLYGQSKGAHCQHDGGTLGLASGSMTPARVLAELDLAETLGPGEGTHLRSLRGMLLSSGLWLTLGSAQSRRA